MGERAREGKPFAIRKSNSELVQVVIRAGEAIPPSLVTIAKADSVKRIVYGVVLDPYGATGPEVDAHEDWTPPADVETAAHEYLKENDYTYPHGGRAPSETIDLIERKE